MCDRMTFSTTFDIKFWNTSVAIKLKIKIKKTFSFWITKSVTYFLLHNKSHALGKGAARVREGSSG